MKKLILVCVFLIMGMNAYCFKSFEVNPFDFIGSREIAILKEFGVNIDDIPFNIPVIEADNLTEFVNLSYAPYCTAGVTINGMIYIQNRNYLLKRFNITLEHEIFHVILHNLGLPHWFEEGLVCELTEEWKDKKRSIIDVEKNSLENLETQWELESYSYSCWLRVKEIMGF